jgi:hypothetical protein
MRKLSDDQLAIGWVAAVALWGLVGLPLLYVFGNKNPLLAFWHWTTHEPVAFYTFVLAVSTIGLWIITWRGIRGQSNETRILQRAYISVEPGGLLEHPDREDRVRCFVTFRNVGHLPARDVRWYGTVWPDGRERQYSSTERSTFSPYETDTFPIGEMEKGSIVLSPGERSSQWIATMFTYRFSNNAFVWGIVTYEDGFGTSRRTKFCHVYRLKELIGQTRFTIPGDQATLHRFGNDAD